MMKIYEVKVARVTADWGAFVGYEKVAVVDSMEKVEKAIEKFRKENEVNQYWMTYDIDKERKIKFYIEETEVG